MKYVLFVCNHNAGRSQMAQAFFERHAPRRRPRRIRRLARRRLWLWPNVIEAMEEVGIDLSARSREADCVEMQLHADWAITMGCGDACPYVPTRVEDWDVTDPADEPLEQVRAIRDEIEARVRDAHQTRLDAIRKDRTAHRLRLARLLPNLIEEFEAMRSPEEIRACADAILSEFDDAGAQLRTGAAPTARPASACATKPAKRCRPASTKERF